MKKYNYSGLPTFKSQFLKYTESTFSFPEIVSTWKKSLYSICSFLRYSRFYSPVTRLARPISDHAYPKNFQSPFNMCEIVQACKKSVNSISSFLRCNQFSINFNFCEFVSACKKWGCLMNLFWKNSWFENPAIEMAESILTCVSDNYMFKVNNRKLEQDVKYVQI